MLISMHLFTSKIYLSKHHFDFFLIINNKSQRLCFTSSKVVTSTLGQKDSTDKAWVTSLPSDARDGHSKLHYKGQLEINIDTVVDTKQS